MARKSSKRQLSPSQIAARKARNQRRNARRKERRRQGGGSSLMATAMDNSQSGFSGHGSYKRKVRGRGGYFGDFLSSAGGKLGNWLEDKAKDLFKGMGDYKDELTTLSSHDVDENSLLCGTQAPAIQNKGQAFIFRHREYVTDVLSSSAFTNSGYTLQPGNQKLFPWLSAIAGAFEEYEFLGAIAEFKPLISLTSNNANGAVVFSTEYNVLKPNFTSKIAMENYEYSTSCAPYQSMFHAIECAPKETAMGSTHRYVNLGSVPSGADARLYNLGNLQLATQGQTTSSVIGEFWITYEVAFYKPLFNIGQGLNLLTDKFWFQNSTVTGGMVWGNNAIVTTKPGSLLGSSFDASTYGKITFPSSVSIGEYLIVATATPTAAWDNTTDINTDFAITNGVIQQVWSNGSGSDQAVFAHSQGAVNLGAHSMMVAYIISINAPGSSQCTFQLPSTSAGDADNAVNCDIVITQINGNILT